MTAQTTPPIVLTIAGSDPSGGAGIQADLKTFAAHGVYGASVVTTITAQNTLGLTGFHPLSVEVVREQLRSVLDDLDITAIKIGMIGNREIAEMLSEALLDVCCPIVLDPVLSATKDERGLSDTNALSVLGGLIKRVSLITPNIPEAESLTGITVDSLDAMQLAGEMLLMMGCENALIKGGHASGDKMTDVLVTPNESYRYTSPRIESKNLHGTGCTLSSAIAAQLARGRELPEAVRIAKEYVTQAIEAATNWNLGSGNGSLNHTPTPTVLRDFLNRSPESSFSPASPLTDFIR